MNALMKIRVYDVVCLPTLTGKISIFLYVYMKNELQMILKYRYLLVIACLDHKKT